MRLPPIQAIGRLFAGLCFCIGYVQPATADPKPPVSPGKSALILVKTPPEALTNQRLSGSIGISARTAGAQELSMNLVVIPPGAAAEPHSHVGYESAVYILEGRVETRYEPGLGQSVITEAGDFLFIPPKVPHQPINLSKTQAARAIVVRNDLGEQEHAIAEGRSQISLLPAPALRAQLERTRIFLDTHGDGLDAALLRLKNAGYLDRRGRSGIRSALERARDSLSRLAEDLAANKTVDGRAARMVS